MTLKQQIEEIIRESTVCGKGKKPHLCGLCKKELKENTDRILAAHNAELDRIAGGMPKGLAEDDGTDWQLGVRHGIQCQYNEGKAYIQAQKGS